MAPHEAMIFPRCFHDIPKKKQSQCLFPKNHEILLKSHRFPLIPHKIPLISLIPHEIPLAPNKIPWNPTNSPSHPPASNGAGIAAVRSHMDVNPAAVGRGAGLGIWSPCRNRRKPQEKLWFYQETPVVSTINMNTWWLISLSRLYPCFFSGISGDTIHGIYKEHHMQYQQW